MINKGELCPTGDDESCYSTTCTCGGWSSSGDSCYCEPGGDDPVQYRGRCHSDDWCGGDDICIDDVCVSSTKGPGEVCSTSDECVLRLSCKSIVG